MVIRRRKCAPKEKTMALDAKQVLQGLLKVGDQISAEVCK
jgi:hypothetical protein